MIRCLLRAMFSRPYTPRLAAEFKGIIADCLRDLRRVTAESGWYS